MAKKVKLTLDQAMDLAIVEGRKGLATSSPNPSVGCVILDKNFFLLATGFHAKAGMPHAEIVALNKIKQKSKLKGAHVVVTLEPCSHTGRTPPCADALAELPIASVYFGLKDPNPLVLGRGISRLRKAGIEVRGSQTHKKQLTNLHEIFLYNQIHKKSFLTLKAAVSLDGLMALKSGESKWITGEKARQDVQRLRSEHDAILVGAGTVKADNPGLNIRDGKFKSKNQKAIILDLTGDVFSSRETFRFYNHFGFERTIWLMPDGLQQQAHHVRDQVIFYSKPSDGLCDWESVKSQLYNLGVCSILVEGGPGVHSDLLRAKAFQRANIYIAPKFLGAKSGLSLSRDFSLDRMSEALALTETSIYCLGDDVLFSGVGFRELG